MKKSKTQDRPQPAQIEAIERCLNHGELEEASRRLTRLQAAFPGFKPLKRLAYEIAWQSGNSLRAVFSAWEWCEASPNSTPAFGALAESSVADFPYLYLHAAERLIALGEGSNKDLQLLRADLSHDLSEDEGRRMDLCRVFLGNEKTAEARALVEVIRLPAAQNNVAQSFFAEGKIERAESVWASVLEMAPENCFTLERLFAMRLWLTGKMAAQALADRLLALTPATSDDVCRQLDGAIMCDLPERAEAIYLGAQEAPWLMGDSPSEGDEQLARRLHMGGALVAWRQGRHDEALSRLDRVDDDSEAFLELRTQCMLFRMTGETPDWGIGHLSQWWPIAHIRSLHPEKFASDNELFERWQATMPHPDYLVAVAVNGGKAAGALAIAALRHLAQGENGNKAAAQQALISLLSLPCGPDSVRSTLHGWLIENGLLEKDAPLSLLVGGKVIEARPLELTIHDEPMEEETVLSAADHRIYGEVMELIHGRRIAKARQLMEKLLPRYPDYPRVLTSIATLREAEGEPMEQWAPLIRHAAEVAPDYFFARAGLVKLLAKEGKLEEARAELRPLLELKEMHNSEWRALILAQIALAKAAKDLPALTRLNGMLRDCQERFG